MNDPTTCTGHIRIDPPLTAAEIREVASRPQVLVALKARHHGLVLHVDRDVEATPTGVVVTVTAAMLTAGQPDIPKRRRDLESALMALLWRFPDHEYTGAIIETGNDGLRVKVEVRSGGASRTLLDVDRAALDDLYHQVVDFRQYGLQPDQQDGRPASDQLAELINNFFVSQGYESIS
jgi:hypothetical protein